MHNPYRIDNPGAFGFLCRVLKLSHLSQDYHVYEGQVNSGLRRHGYGRCIFLTGEWYQGHWNNDKQHGLGRAMRIVEGPGEVSEGGAAATRQIIVEGEWCDGALVKEKKIVRW